MGIPLLRSGFFSTGGGGGGDGSESSSPRPDAVVGPSSFPFSAVSFSLGDVEVMSFFFLAASSSSFSSPQKAGMYTKKAASASS